MLALLIQTAVTHFGPNGPLFLPHIPLGRSKLSLIFLRFSSRSSNGYVQTNLIVNAYVHECKAKILGLCGRAKKENVTINIRYVYISKTLSPQLV